MLLEGYWKGVIERAREIAFKAHERSLEECEIHKGIEIYRGWKEISKLAQEFAQTLETALYNQQSLEYRLKEAKDIKDQAGIRWGA